MPARDVGQPTRDVGLQATNPAPAMGATLPADSAEDVEFGRGTEPSARHFISLGPGSRVRQYEIIRQLGAGGMGTVFLARDTKLGRRVAMKFMSGAGTEHFVERFLVEARATAQCNHENIVIIHEVDEHHGMPYMVLEYLEGEPLSEIVGDERIPVSRAVELIVPVVRALARAHDLDIVHRDLKPDNVFVTSAGLIKVLDFGIAKLFTQDDDEAQTVSLDDIRRATGSTSRPGSGSGPLTGEGAIIGTLPYMSPEQFGVAPVDARSDFWAVGIMLWEMIAGKHPISHTSPRELWEAATSLDEPMPRIGQEVPEIPTSLERVIDGCLSKDKDGRFDSAAQILELLEPLLPGRFGRQLEEGESPYPGLTAFQEADADRFFGRSREIVRAVKRIRDQPLVGIVGPSGVGKSSFVRAGIVPALKSSGEDWEVFTIRPGRDPLAGLASMLQPITTSSSTDLSTKIEEHQQLVERLRTEPGYLGTLLRSRARQSRGHILLFIDQFEELFTLVDDQDHRGAYLACIAGVADDSATPLRVVVSMRSDLLDRVAEHRRFGEELTQGLMFLPPPDRAALREALTLPVEMVGYRFESDAMVGEMLDALESSPGALPLLQFAAAKLWERRNRKDRTLTHASYEEMGGVAGTLAGHANEVMAGLGPPAQKLVRSIFQRLVTPDGTRAIVDVSDLCELSRDQPSEVERLVRHLVQARLLTSQSRGDEGPAVEIVHESLITSWPTLRRWLDESHEDAAFLEQLRTTAKQWDARGRPPGLLWRGETMREARRWYERYQGTLGRREAEYLDEVLRLADRAVRRRRRIVVGAFGVVTALAVAAVIGMLLIRGAERDARDAEGKANEQAQVAKDEAERAQAAERKVTQQLDLIRAKEKAKREAEEKLDLASAEVATSKEELRKANLRLREALIKANDAKDRAEKETRKSKQAATKIQKLADEARKAQAETARLLKIERKRRKELEREKRKISTGLKD